MGTEEMDKQQYEEVLKSFEAEPTDEDTGGQDDDFPVPVDVKRRAEANGEAVEEQVLPYRTKPVLQETWRFPFFESTNLNIGPYIPHHEKIEAASKMLNQRRQEAGGFNPDEPVPSLWYADIKALRDGMRARVDHYADHYERWVLKPVRNIIYGYRQVYKRKHGRMPPFRQQREVNHLYHMVFEGKPWDEIKKYATYLLPQKRVKHIQKHVRPDHFDEGRGSITNVLFRDGIMHTARPFLLQWYAAKIALNSIAMQVPIRDLPNHDESPFKGKEKSLEYARAIVEAFDAEVEGIRQPKKKKLSSAIERQGVDAVNAYKSMRDTMGIRVGEDYEKGDVAGYVEAVRVLLYRHEVNAGQS